MEYNPWISALSSLLMMLIYVTWGLVVWQRYRREAALPRNVILAFILSPSTFGVALAIWALPYFARAMFPNDAGYQFLAYVIWGLGVWYAVTGSRPTAKPGFFGRLMFSPMCFWLSFFCWAPPALLNGLFPTSPGPLRTMYSDLPISLAILAAIFGLGPQFIIEAEARFRNKFGAFYEKAPALNAWRVEALGALWLGRLAGQR